MSPFKAMATNEISNENSVIYTDHTFQDPGDLLKTQYNDQDQACDLTIVTRDGLKRCHKSIFLRPSTTLFSEYHTVYNFDGSTKELEIILSYFYNGSVSIPKKISTLEVLIKEFQRIRPKHEICNILQTTLSFKLLVRKEKMPTTSSAQGRPSQVTSQHANEPDGSKTNGTARQDITSSASPLPGPSGLRLHSTVQCSRPSHTSLSEKMESCQATAGEKLSENPPIPACPPVSPPSDTSAPTATLTSNSNQLDSSLQTADNSSHLSNESSRTPTLTKSSTGPPASSSSLKSAQKNSDSTTQCDKFISNNESKSVHFASNASDNSGRSSTPDQPVSSSQSKSDEPPPKKLCGPASCRREIQKRALAAEGTQATVRKSANIEKEPAKSTQVPTCEGGAKVRDENATADVPDKPKEAQASKSSKGPSAEKVTKSVNANATASSSDSSKESAATSKEGELVGQTGKKDLSAKKPQKCQKEAPAKEPRDEEQVSSREDENPTADSEDYESDLDGDSKTTIFRCKSCLMEFRLKMALQKHKNKCKGSPLDNQEKTKQNPPAKRANEGVSTQERRKSTSSTQEYSHDVDMQALDSFNASIPKIRVPNSLGLVQQKTPTQGSNKSSANSQPAHSATKTIQVHQRSQARVAPTTSDTPKDSSNQSQKQTVRTHSEKGQRSPPRITKVCGGARNENRGLKRPSSDTSLYGEKRKKRFSQDSN